MKKSLIVIMILVVILLASIIVSVNAVIMKQDLKDKTREEIANELKEKQESLQAKTDFISIIVMFDEKPIDKSLLNAKKIIDKRNSEKNKIKNLVSNAEIIKEYNIFDGLLVRINKKDLGKLKKIEKNGVKVFPSYKLKLALSDSVPQVHAPEVWQEGYTGAGVKVAVMDTGVDFTHPALSSRQLDCRHWLGQGTDVGVGCDDWYGHGTHVAGTIASTNSTYKGVAYGSGIMAYQVLDDTGVGYDSDLVSAIEYAVNNGADIISMSLGVIVNPSDPNCGDPLGDVVCYCYQTPISQASDNAVDAGVVVVAAAGNDGTDYYMNAPACANKSIAVGAVDVNDDVAIFSNKGPDLDLVAPGVDVVSSVPSTGYLVSAGYCDTSGWCSLDGTSMATPHVSGAVALLLQKNPNLTPTQIRNLLRQTADDLLTEGRDDASGYGRLNVYNAYLALSPKPKNLTLTTYKDSAYTEKIKFFDFNDAVYVEAKIKDFLGNDINDASVTADFYKNNSLENSVNLNFISNGIYRNSYTPLSNGVYLINITATNSYGSANKETKIHVYSGIGVSGYILDLGSSDYIIENQHLIAGFDIQQTSSPIRYLKQKDTNYDFNFSVSSDASSTNRMGLSNGTGKIKMNINSYIEGENLGYGSIKYIPITEGTPTYSPPLNDADKTCSQQWGNCQGCGGNTIDSCGSCYSGCYSYVQEVTIDKTVYKPGDSIIVTVDYYCGSMSSLIDAVFVSYNDGTGWKQKGYEFCDADYTYPTYQITFPLTGTGQQNVRASVQMFPEVGQTCAGICPDIGGDNDDVTFNVAQEVINETKIADLDIILRDENDDFLLYKLNNFTSYFPDYFSSDITGSFDLISDDYYYVGGNNGTVSSLPSGWQTYTPSYKYISHYDSDNLDSVGYNSLGIVHFDSTLGINFNNLALKKGSLNSRISYNSPSVTANDEVNYLFVFSLGDYRTIDDWMSSIENKTFPEPNFLSKAKCENGKTRLCQNQKGVCFNATQTCVNNLWPGCDYFSIPNYQQQETLCDGLDNDCDNVIDEGCIISDSDNDGVIDVWDDCPNTPLGSYVNNRGCPGGGGCSLAGDINCDCVVDISDLATVGLHFDETCSI